MIDRVWFFGKYPFEDRFNGLWNKCIVDTFLDYGLGMEVLDMKVRTDKDYDIYSGQRYTLKQMLKFIKIQGDEYKEIDRSDKVFILGSNAITDFLIFPTKNIFGYTEAKFEIPPYKKIFNSIEHGILYESMADKFDSNAKKEDTVLINVSPTNHSKELQNILLVMQYIASCKKNFKFLIIPNIPIELRGRSEEMYKKVKDIIGYKLMYKYLEGDEYYKALSGAKYLLHIDGMPVQYILLALEFNVLPVCSYLYPHLLKNIHNKIVYRNLTDISVILGHTTPSMGEYPLIERNIINYHEQTADRIVKEVIQ